jgi:hypothetical protein
MLFTREMQSGIIEEIIPHWLLSKLNSGIETLEKGVASKSEFATIDNIKKLMLDAKDSYSALAIQPVRNSD